MLFNFWKKNFNSIKHTWIEINWIQIEFFTFSHSPLIDDCFTQSAFFSKDIHRLTYTIKKLDMLMVKRNSLDELYFFRRCWQSFPTVTRTNINTQQQTSDRMNIHDQLWSFCFEIPTIETSLKRPVTITFHEVSLVRHCFILSTLFKWLLSPQ